MSYPIAAAAASDCNFHVFVTPKTRFSMTFVIGLLFLRETKDRSILE